MIRAGNICPFGRLSALLLMNRGGMNDDHELLQQFRAGAQDAFNQLVARHVTWIFPAALRQVRDAAQRRPPAEEAAGGEVVDLRAPERLKTFFNAPPTWRGMPPEIFMWPTEWGTTRGWPSSTGTASS